MKSNEAAIDFPGQDQAIETAFSASSPEWFPGASWTEFEDSFIQVLTNPEPAKKYFHLSEIKQPSTC